MDKIVHIFFNQTWKSGQFTRTTCATKFCFPIKIYFVVGKILGELKGAFPGKGRSMLCSRGNSQYACWYFTLF